MEQTPLASISNMSDQIGTRLSSTTKFNEDINMCCQNQGNISEQVNHGSLGGAFSQTDILRDSSYWSDNYTRLEDHKQDAAAIPSDSHALDSHFFVNDSPVTGSGNLGPPSNSHLNDYELFNRKCETENAKIYDSSHITSHRTHSSASHNFSINSHDKNYRKWETENPIMYNSSHSASLRLPFPVDSHGDETTRKCETFQTSQDYSHRLQQCDSHKDKTSNKCETDDVFTAYPPLWSCIKSTSEVHFSVSSSQDTISQNDNEFSPVISQSSFESTEHVYGPFQSKSHDSFATSAFPSAFVSSSFESLPVVPPNLCSELVSNNVPVHHDSDYVKHNNIELKRNKTDIKKREYNSLPNYHFTNSKNGERYEKHSLIAYHGVQSCRPFPNQENRQKGGNTILCEAASQTDEVDYQTYYTEFTSTTIKTQIKTRPKYRLMRYSQNYPDLRSRSCDDITGLRLVEYVPKLKRNVKRLGSNKSRSHRAVQTDDIDDKYESYHLNNESKFTQTYPDLKSHSYDDITGLRLTDYIPGRVTVLNGKFFQKLRRRNPLSSLRSKTIEKELHTEAESTSKLKYNDLTGLRITGSGKTGSGFYHCDDSAKTHISYTHSSCYENVGQFGTLDSRSLDSRSFDSRSLDSRSLEHWVDGNVLRADSWSSEKREGRWRFVEKVEDYDQMKAEQKISVMSSK